MDEKLYNEFWGMRFGLRQMFFYHEKRVILWRGLLFVTQGLEMALNSTAAAFLFNEGTNSATRWIVLVSAILSGVAVWFGAEKRIQRNMDMKAKYHDLIGKVPRRPEKYTEELLDEIEAERNALERENDPVMPCVYAAARNDACRALGIPEDRGIGPIDFLVGSILPIPYRHKPFKGKQETVPPSV